jgi:hypothetical protein
MRRALACFSSRQVKLQAVKVLPAPVAIWMSERGRSAASEASRPVMASTWHWRRPVASSGGIFCSRARSVPGSFSQACSVAGWWKANTRRERGVGSRASRK